MSSVCMVCYRTALFKLFTFLKITKDIKKFCLCGLYLFVVSVLKIKMDIYKSTQVSILIAIIPPGNFYYTSMRD
jgi:hypothetical protein